MAHERRIAPARYSEKELVAGDCPECGTPDLKAYKVLTEGGWFSVVKCGQCLHSVEREPWNLCGYVRDAELSMVRAAIEASA